VKARSVSDRHACAETKDRPAPGASEPAVDRHIYSCFDFRLASDLPLDELAPAAADDRRPMVVVRLGAVEEQLANASASLHGLQVAGAVALLALPGIGRFLMNDGCEIVVDPHPGVSPRDLRLFLLGSVMGILCHQRGLLPLHANAIVAGGGAFAFAGPSGAGKSTLAGEFQRRGLRLLADDVCMVDFDEAGAAVAWPGIPRLKLWGDAAERFGLDCAELDRVNEESAKYHVPSADIADPRPVPLRRLYLLSRADAGAPRGIVRLRGQQAMAALVANTYRGLCLRPMSLHARHFHQCAALLASVRVYSAPRLWGFDCFDREVDRLERHLFEKDHE
jgi:hypothetical protein